MNQGMNALAKKLGLRLFMQSKDPLAWGSLLLRILLIGWVLASHHWMGSDSLYYLSSAQGICHGEWGGDGSRQPLYSWMLCALSPHISPQSGPYQAALPLLFQFFFVWLSGLVLMTFAGKRIIGALWFFDPALLVYSTNFMSDALFAALILLLAILIHRTLSASSRGEKTYAGMAAVGFFLGLTMLGRSIGVPLALLTFLMLGFFLYRDRARQKKQQFAKLALTALMALLIVSPRVYWNITRHHSWSIAMQGGGYLNSVAASVAYSENGVDFYEAEARWNKEKADQKPNAVFNVFLHYPLKTAFLTIKSVARVLIGHVNVEWAYLLTGQAPIGPGWFKVPEKREGMHITGLKTAPWIAGMVATAAFCLFTYWGAFKSFRGMGLDAFTVWALLSALLLALVPLTWGDARFRLPIWPLVLMVWGWNEKRAISRSRAS